MSSHNVAVSELDIRQEAFVPPDERPPIFGDGNAAQRIVKILEDFVETQARSQPREKSKGEVPHVQKTQVTK